MRGQFVLGDSCEASSPGGSLSTLARALQSA